MNLPELPNFVLVGGPAPESGNVLIVPLAGHEIGHWAWGKLDVENRVRPKIFQEFLNYVQQNKDYFDDLAVRIDTETGGAGNLSDFVLNCLSKKAEEVFCDLFGLYIFGAGYVYAFEYLLAPGFGSRNRSYPPELQRIVILAQAASVYGINISPEAFDGWRRPAAPKTLEDKAIEVADCVLETCVSLLIDETCELLKDRGITPVRNDKVRAVREAFSRGAPYGEGATLPEIVVAGWEYVREQGGLANPKEYDKYDMLQELMLKSVEVSEVETRRSDHRDKAV